VTKDSVETGGAGQRAVESSSHTTNEEKAMPEDREPSKQERSEPGVLVGVDGSEASMVAVDWAAHNAACLDRSLTVCYVSPTFDQLGMPLRSELAQEYADRSRDITAAAANRARTAEPGLSVQTHVAYGQTAAELRDAAGETSTVVVGRHGVDRLRRLVIGSVSSQLATHALGPVVITKENPIADTGPVVVGVDDAPQVAALEFAFAIASASGAAITALHAIRIPGPLVAPYVPPVDSYIRQARATAQEQLDDAVAPWLRKYPDVDVRREVIDGSSADALVEASRGARLLVVGHRGRGGFTGLLMGSTAQHVLALAECPVAVTH
jgi:nucleotide-binding universal stress UspA family protein